LATENYLAGTEESDSRAIETLLKEIRIDENRGKGNSKDK